MEGGGRVGAGRDRECARYVARHTHAAKQPRQPAMRGWEWGGRGRVTGKVGAWGGGGERDGWGRGGVTCSEIALTASSDSTRAMSA